MGSLWPAVIAAMAALSGAGLNQILQGRREKLRWQLEREQDDRQRLEARDRDCEAWAREDRNRFIETKRSTYAEYLTHLRVLDDVLRYTEKSMKEVAALRHTDDDPFDTGLLWHGAGIDERVEREGQAADLVRQVVRLVSPPSVWKTAELVQAQYLLAVTKALSGKSAEFETARTSFIASRSKLLELMRRDLGMDDRPIETVGTEQ
jgi:hypothetical protein